MIGETTQHPAGLHELGRGGTGLVYEAEDTRLGRRVAVEILSAAVGMPDYPAFMRGVHFEALDRRSDFKELLTSLKAGRPAHRAEFEESGRTSPASGVASNRRSR